MLSGGKSKSWNNSTFNGWVVGVIHEKHNTVHGTVDLEVSLEESSSLQVDSHCGEDNGEIFFIVILDIFSLDERSLSTDLWTDLIMRKQKV